MTRASSILRAGAASPLGLGALALATALMAAGTAPALGQAIDCTTSGGVTYCDPTSFHVTSPSATGTDPVLLNEATTFNIDDIDNGATIDNPLTIYFAVPDSGGGAPTVTDYSFDGGAKTLFGGPLTDVGDWDPATIKDLYTFVGCVKCDGSINDGNVEPEEALFGFSTPTKFTVYSLTIDQGFGGNTDFETVDGVFPKGTIIAPLSKDVSGKKTTFYDTSWTNAGFVDATTSVPEPATWAMMALGFAGLGFAGYRKARPAISIV